MGKHRSSVQDWMTEKPQTATVDMSLATAYELMSENEVRRLPVLEGGELAGIITLSDLLRSIPNFQSQNDRETRLLVGTRKVRDVMTWDPITVDPEETIQDAAERMLEYQVSGLPVTDGNRLVGTITESDIFRLVVESWSAES